MWISTNLTDLNSPLHIYISFDTFNSSSQEQQDGAAVSLPSALKLKPYRGIYDRSCPEISREIVSVIV